MIKKSMKKEIINLIESGFDIELISFELDIPVEDIIELKNQIDNVDYEKIKSNIRKLEQMRERYRKLFFRVDETKDIPPRSLSNEENELIELTLIKIEETINKMDEMTKFERRTSAKDIIEEMKKLQDYQLTIEQAEKMFSMLQLENMQNLKLKKEDRIDWQVYDTKRKIVKKLADAIDIAQFQTEEIEELKALSSKITIQMEGEFQIPIGAVKARINRKIYRIQEQQAIARIKNENFSNISDIVSDLASGIIDFEKANIAINEEAKRRVENKPRNQFSVTEEDEKRQIFMQIRKLIVDEVDKYNINNPELLITQMQELCGINLEHSVRTVVDALINRKEFETAKEICKKFYRMTGKNQMTSGIKVLRNKIRNAEISNIVLSVINMNGTEEEENRNFELIEEGISKGNVNLREVSLGKSQDGLKNITLADIWKDEKKREKAK